MINSNYLIQRIESIKDDLNRIKRDINYKTINDLENAWNGQEARNFTSKLETVEYDIKKINNLLDKLIIYVDNYNKINSIKNNKLR